MTLDIHHDCAVLICWLGIRCNEPIDYKTYVYIYKPSFTENFYNYLMMKHKENIPNINYVIKKLQNISEKLTLIQ